MNKEVIRIEFKKMCILYVGKIVLNNDPFNRVKNAIMLPDNQLLSLIRKNDHWKKKRDYVATTISDKKYWSNNNLNYYEFLTISDISMDKSSEPHQILFRGLALLMIGAYFLPIFLKNGTEIENNKWNQVMDIINKHSFYFEVCDKYAHSIYGNIDDINPPESMSWIFYYFIIKEIYEEKKNSKINIETDQWITDKMDLDNALQELMDENFKDIYGEKIEEFDIYDYLIELDGWNADEN
jgi:hypothetical protein